MMFLKTAEGVVWIDTANSKAEVQAALDLAEVKLDEVSMLITTHADGDHIGGNSRPGGFKTPYSQYPCPGFCQVAFRVFLRALAQRRTADRGKVAAAG